MSQSIYIIAAVIIGIAVSVQPPINATMARVLGDPLLAATVSIFISFVVVSLLWLSWGKGNGDFSQIRALPWWVLVGGLIGVVFVAGSIVIAPVIGVALFFVCIVAGQILGSIVIDQLGAFDLAVKPINTMKLMGLVLVLVGAGLVQMSNA